MSRFTQALAGVAAALSLSFTIAGAVKAEEFGAWEAKQVSSVFVAQTRSDSLALYIVCSPQIPGMVANLVTGQSVPAYGELPGPVASFMFGEAEPMQVGALPNDSTDQPERILTMAMHGERMTGFLDRLKREREVGVAVAGGPSGAQLQQVSGVLSLSGSSKAISFIAKRCNQA